MRLEVMCKYKTRSQELIAVREMMDDPEVGGSLRDGMRSTVIFPVLGMLHLFQRLM